MMSYLLIADSITWTLVTLLSLLFTYYIYDLWTNNIFVRMRMPGPTPIPLLGEMVNFFRKGVYANDVDLVRKYGKVIGVFEGTAPIILVTDPDLLRKVLIKDSHLFINRRTIEAVSGPFEHGLTGLKGEAWKNARSIVSPTFSSAKLKAMFTLMNQVSDIYRDRLLEYADTQEPVDVKSLNGQYTLDNIASCLFGIETNSLQNENVTLINHLKKFFTFSLANIRVLIIFVSPRLRTFLVKRGYSMLPNDAVDYITGIVNQVLARRRQHLERRNDFIQTMIDHEEAVAHEGQSAGGSSTDAKKEGGSVSKKVLSDKEIFGQALVFLVAGYETTSVLMSFLVYVLATEPAIQEKVHQEMQSVLGDEEVTVEKLNQLHYLDMVIDETLRMYPPFIRFDRVASIDYQLGDYLIPKGSIVSVPIYPLHHDPSVWPDPGTFIPERFSAAEKAKRDSMTFLPFGDGPRNCIGMRFALLEAKLAIAKALRTVEIQRCEKTEVPLQLGKLAVLSSKNGIWVSVTRRSD